jgi:hypothetical protein
MKMEKEVMLPCYSCVFRGCRVVLPENLFRSVAPDTFLKAIEKMKLKKFSFSAKSR